MKRLVYTLLSEGHAETSFIPILLNKIGESHKIQFVKSSLSIKPSSNPSRSKVKAKIEEFALQSLVLKNENLFIFGYDLDEQDVSGELMEREILEINQKIKSHDNQKIVFFIPVQCFDHWLVYQSQKTGKKHVAGTLEKHPCGKMKEALYGDRKDIPAIEKRAKAIAENLDIEVLRKQSKSFAAFHSQLLTFLQERKP